MILRSVVLKEDNRPFQLVCFVFPFQTGWWYPQELFLSNVVLCMHPYACVCVISKKANFLENRLGKKGISVWNFWEPYISIFLRLQGVTCRRCFEQGCVQVSDVNRCQALINRLQVKKKIQVRVPSVQFITMAWWVLHDALHCGECN